MKIIKDIFDAGVIASEYILQLSINYLWNYVLFLGYFITIGLQLLRGILQYKSADPGAVQVVPRQCMASFSSVFPFPRISLVFGRDRYLLSA